MALVHRFSHLALIVDRWRTGARRRVRPRDWETLPYFEIEAVLILSAAYNRSRLAEIRQPPGEGNGDAE